MPNTIFNIPLLSYLLRLLSLLLLKALGWQVEGKLPAERKFVLIAAPHTSNWDAFYMIMVSFVFRVNLYWMGKHTLFKSPFGFLTRFVGGIPIDRSTSSGMVEQSVQVLKDSSTMVLAIPPEGTRKKVPYWKTGFYQIAHQANPGQRHRPAYSALRHRRSRRRRKFYFLWPAGYEFPGR